MTDPPFRLSVFWLGDDQSPVPDTTGVPHVQLDLQTADGGWVGQRFTLPELAALITQLSSVHHYYSKRKRRAYHQTRPRYSAERHREILRRYEQGQTQQEIARAFGIAQSSVSYYIHRPLEVKEAPP